MHITKQFLDKNPNVIFVFGDNTKRKGKGGAAKLRSHPQTYGFVTKRAPNNKPESFFCKESYRPIFQTESMVFEWEITQHRHLIYLVSRVGAGLANRHGIYEYLIKDWREKLVKKYSNVILL